MKQPAIPIPIAPASEATARAISVRSESWVLSGPAIELVECVCADADGEEEGGER